MRILIANCIMIIHTNYANKYKTSIITESFYTRLYEIGLLLFLFDTHQCSL